MFHQTFPDIRLRHTDRKADLTNIREPLERRPHSGGLASYCPVNYGTLLQQNTQISINAVRFKRRQGEYASSGSKCCVLQTLPAGFLGTDKENLRPLPSATMVKPHTMTSACGSSVGIQVTVTPTRALCAAGTRRTICY